jgi:ferredoxin-fold anticodon binding domain-containing protein
MVALYCLQVLTHPQLRKFPKVRRIRRVFDISIIVKVNITFVVIISCTEWQGEIVNVVSCLIGRGREFFEDTLEVVPVKHTNRWEGD